MDSNTGDNTTQGGVWMDLTPAEASLVLARRGVTPTAQRFMDELAHNLKRDFGARVPSLRLVVGGAA